MRRKACCACADEHEHSRVTYVELFFDLVFVFAITQLSHTLLEHLSLGGLLQTTLLLMAVWWVWIYTSWVTNWLDPEKTPVRLLLFAPDAGGPRSLHLDPAGLRVEGRSRSPAPMSSCRSAARLFMVWALKGHSPGNYRNFQRIICWLALSAPVLDRGRLCAGRYALRALGRRACSSSTSGPRSASGRRASAPRRHRIGTWKAAIWPSAARLFVIIALGESVLVTGATFAKLPWTPVTVASFLVAFVGSVAMWWIYFNIGAERGSRHIAASDDPGRVAPARLHLPAPAAGGRHHRGGSRRRARARPSRRSHRRQDRRRADRRAGALSGRAISCSSVSAPGIFRCRIWSGWGCWRCWSRRRPLRAPWRSAAPPRSSSLLWPYGRRGRWRARGRADADTGSFAHSVLWRR